MNTLIIFIKYPEPGKVKTRLAKELGDSKAATIYSHLAKTVIEKTFDPNCYKTVIFYDPPGMEKEIKKWINNDELNYLPQIGNSLGEKISNAFDVVYSSGSDKAVIVGSDCIDVNKEIINKTIGLLDMSDVILGPAKDGGYYLLATREYHPDLFQDIEWSTNLVLKQTMERIKDLGLNFEILKTLSDIDTVDDLREANIEIS